MYREILAADPQNVSAWHLLGRLAQQLGAYDEAAECLGRALQLRPNYPEAYVDLGAILKARGDIEGAIAAFGNARELNPASVEAHYNLAATYQEQGRFDAAATSYRQALQLRPDIAQAHHNLGFVLEKQGRLDEAADCYRAALALAPTYADAHYNLGIALQQRGELDEAVACFGRALEVNPDFPEAHWRRAQVQLLRGDFENGWPEFEWRTRCAAFPAREFAKPAWDGRPLEGKTLLIHAEQGLGDAIQFVRYLPLVKQRGAIVVLESERPLLRLLADCRADRLIARGDPLPPFDFQTSLLGLPRIFKTTLQTIPADVPYLFAAEPLVEQWRERLKVIEGFRIGIAWQGNPNFRDDRERSIPLADFAALGSIPGVTLVSLQKGAGAEQLPEVRGQFSVVTPGDDVDTTHGAFMDTAAIMKNLDLVITSDTAIAHLAGALAAPVWVALSFVPDWRWLLGRSDSPWYPTMRLFRQKQPGDWRGVFQQIGAALHERLGP